MIGAGFAGSLLSRLLARQGYSVVLVERGRHPRFALGESSTPLANLALERIARSFGCDDLYQLAAYGRWRRTFPGVRRGLKRGFTFYAHRPGEPFRNDRRNQNRLLVAASPADEVADAQWLRSDVDQHFARQAEAAGVDYRDETELTEVRVEQGRVDVAGYRRGEPVRLRARFLVDASGPGAFLARHLPLRAHRQPLRSSSSLVYGHFSGVPPFSEVAVRGGAILPVGPYADDWAAVHHLLAEGWMYSLRFDHGVVSAGILLRETAAAELDERVPASPRQLWDRVLSRYPTLRTQLAEAETVEPLRATGRLQHRLARATGPGWAMLPHTYAFVDPLFSTGIAWSLLGVERLAELLAEIETRGCPSAAGLARYDALISAEAEQIDALVHGAYLALPDFGLFSAHAMLYFATVSFAEARQRLLAPAGASWEGFLGADDPTLARLFSESSARLGLLSDGGRRAANPEEREQFAAWMAAAIAPWNVAGLADPRRCNLYPVDLDTLVERAHLLGLTPRAVKAALPRLRGFTCG